MEAKFGKGDLDCLPSWAAEIYGERVAAGGKEWDGDSADADGEAIGGKCLDVAGVKGKTQRAITRWGGGEIG